MIVPEMPEVAQAEEADHVRRAAQKKAVRAAMTTTRHPKARLQQQSVNVRIVRGGHAADAPREAAEVAGASDRSCDG